MTTKTTTLDARQVTHSTWRLLGADFFKSLITLNIVAPSGLGAESPSNSQAIVFPRVFPPRPIPPLTRGGIYTPPPVRKVTKETKNKKENENENPRAYSPTKKRHSQVVRQHLYPQTQNHAGRIRS